MTRPTRKRHLGVWGGGTLFAAWLIVIVIGIYNEPPGGAASLHALKDDTVTALHTHDTDGFQLLFVGDSVTRVMAAD